MSRHLVTLEIDPERDEFDEEWGVNFDFAGHRDGEIEAIAKTLQTGWDHEPSIRVLDVESPKLGLSGRLHEALTQIQHVSYEDVGDDLTWARAKLERICNIAESCTPDEDWTPLSEDEHGDIAGGGDAQVDYGHRPSAGERLIEEMREETGYHPEVEGSVDDLIAYKDALEDRLMQALDEAPGGPGSVLPDDVRALIAATFSRDADTIEALEPTWERLRALFPGSLAPAPEPDGITRIGGGHA